MEFTLKTVVVAILVLILLLICATLIMGWGEESNNIFHVIMKNFNQMLFGE